MAPKTRASARSKPTPKTTSAGKPKSTSVKPRGVKRKATSLRLGQPKKARTTNLPKNAINFRVPAGSKHPPWAALPYQILVSIFQNAAYPLVDENWNRCASVRWLLATSLVCKAFAEPALAALYHGPPMVHTQHYIGFMRLVNSEATLSIDYRSKVHQLDFEVNYLRFAANVAKTLAELIARLPALRAFGIHQAADHPQPGNISPAQTTRAEFIYCKDWINSLASAKLSRLDWSSLHMRGQLSSRFEHWALQDDIVNPAFRSLETLEIAGLVDRPLEGRNLSGALEALPHLRRLSFLRCNFNERGLLSTDEMVIYHLPSTLTSLELIACTEFDSDELTMALRRCCALRSLVLRHNFGPSLSFLTSLAEVCPVLQDLEYDLQLFSTSLVISHAEPWFREILAPGEIPTWPKTLQSLGFNQLRKWDLETATAFFNSLRNSAASLPDLRRLSVTASVGSGWRDRVKFREEIISPLIDVFSRHSEPVVTPQAARKPARQSSRGHTQESRVHGKCDLVYIRVDNLRPAEEQLNEGDFLDDEQSGDDNYVD